VETMTEWETRFIPVMRLALEALNHCDRTFDRRWAPALLADTDQLRAAGMTMEKWGEANPCPHRDLAMAVARMSRSCEHAAANIESVARAGSTCTWLVVERELRGLHSLVGRVLAQFHDGHPRMGGPVQGDGVEGRTDGKEVGLPD
jgi:hypothetical protein